MQRILYACLLSFSAMSIQAQSIFSAYDSLAVKKPKSGKDLFQLNHALKQVEVLCEKPEAVSLIPRKSGFFASALTLLTGIGTSSSTESSWLLPGHINCANSADSWDVLLYAEGEYVKNKERIRNDDGSVSVDTQKGVVIQWDKGAYGLVRHHSDTLAVFQTAPELSSDSLITIWLPTLRDHGRNVAYKLRKYVPFGSGGDLYLRGVFRDQPFILITDGQSYQSLFVMNGEPLAIFQQATPFIILSKKDKIRPFFLFRKGLSPSESAEIIKLSLLAIMLRTLQSQEMLAN